jgi:hypothetical protein
MNCALEKSLPCRARCGTEDGFHHAVGHLASNTRGSDRGSGGASPEHLKDAMAMDKRMVVASIVADTAKRR